MPDDTIITQKMKKSVGVESEPLYYDVEKGHIARFAEAIGDANPLYVNDTEARDLAPRGIIAPPTFLRSCVAPPIKVDVQAETGKNRVLDGGSEWTYFHLVRPGDRISVTSKIAEFKQREGRMGVMLITTVETAYRNQLGQLVATQRVNRILY